MKSSASDPFNVFCKNMYFMWDYLIFFPCDYCVCMTQFSIFLAAEEGDQLLVTLIPF